MTAETYRVTYKQRTRLAIALLLLGCSTAFGQFTDPAVVNWMINTDGATGSSVDAEIHELVSQILADVQAVSYTDTFVYVETSGVPSYMTGPFPDGNPTYPSDLDATYRIPRSPQMDSSGNNAEVGLGPQGVFINGVALFNYADGMSYNNQGIWNQDANFFEADGFDAAPGHPAPVGFGPPGGGPPGGGGALVAGRYHHHQNPVKLRDVVGDDGSTHSPILGFAFDGFPIYGPYGYVDPADPASEIVRIESGYQLRDITQRTTLPDGTGLSAALYGPSFAEAELGAYQEDYVFDAASGDLDEHNGQFAITPDYPEGTYAYFVTLDENGDTAFPHMLGPTFYGQVASQQNLVIPAGATEYVPSQPTNLGDFNGNGQVDAADYTLWRDALGQTVTPNTGPDANGDGTINQEDFLVWHANFGLAVGASATRAVPEPGSIGLFVLFALFFGLSFAGRCGPRDQFEGRRFFSR